MRAFKAPNGETVVTIRQIKFALQEKGIDVSIQAIRYHIGKGKYFDGKAWLSEASRITFDDRKIWLVDAVAAEAFIATYKPRDINRGSRNGS